MAFFFLFALYLLPRQRLLAMISVLLSGGVKFLTFVTLPFFFWPKKIVERSLVMLLLVLIPVIILREAYSWYFLPPLAVVALINNRTLWILAVATTFGLLLRYLPFLYLGQESLAPENLLTIVPVVLCGLGLTFYRRR
ncbi:hypothetical protein M1345_03700 [Patescibacteria group bacterium]|nr:hypothetical protein [Patescibacteria group bacterium]